MLETPRLNSREALRSPGLWSAPRLPFLPWGDGASRLGLYVDLLLKWNKALNLSGCHDAVSLLGTLVQDSFFLAQFLDRLELGENCRLYDLGAGAGLPGVPLRIFWRRGDYILVERNQKRVIFLQNVLARLCLSRTRIHSGDAEVFIRKRLATADAVISRAFMPWPRILDLCRPAMTRGGQLIIMANQAPPDTLPGCWRLGQTCAYELPGARKRWLWALVDDSLHVQV